MQTLTINLEIGHDAALREKTTTEGFTHDWEVFVRGCNGADIRHYVDRVVFLLHETFEKPKRVVKEPPYSLRTSGYAGFNLPIQIHLKNNQEPRKIQFNYDLQLQPSGPPIHEVQKEKYTFHSVSEDFRNKLLKGGAVLGGTPVTSDNSSSVHLPKPEDKSQMMSKPRLSGSEQPKKYKLKPEEPRSDQFTNLFGTPITKSSKITELPKSKESSIKPQVKNSDKDKGEKISGEKDKSKTKSPYKDKEKDRERSKDKDKQTENSNFDRKSKDKRDKKDREYSKKDKKERKDRDRDKSPTARQKSSSPKRSPKRPRSPSPVKTSVKELKEKDKESRESKDRDRDREKKSKKHKDLFDIYLLITNCLIKEKDGKHRDKDKEKDRDKPIADHSKDYKVREMKSSKEKERDNVNNSISSSNKEKDRDISPIVNMQTPKIEKKEKIKDKDSKEADKSEEAKPKDKEKSDDKEKERPKHKHKKKDKDRKEKKDRELHKKEKEEKKTKEVSAKEREKADNLFGSSPKSEPSPGSAPPDLEIDKSPHMEDDSSNTSKLSSREPSPANDTTQAGPCPRSPSPLPSLEVTRLSPQEEHLSKKPRFDDVSKKEKKERKKDKKADRDQERKRKRKVEAETQVEIEEPPIKLHRKEAPSNDDSDDERKVSSSEDSKSVAYTDDPEAYMSMLRELQTKIMGLKDQSDLQRVVQLIADTGKFEVSSHTFDFDLCLLDRATVMQLHSFLQ
ncbi:hypothetical protein HUJ05_011614 [Dendroctonus ponderosae]|nr:hypothetical protein HUJ05_011614 [Dendroctonus ponderosae]